MSDPVFTVPATEHSVDAPGQRRLPPLLRKSWFGLNQAFRRRLAGLGITPNQFTVLRWLLESSDNSLPQKELTVKMSSDPNTMASLLSRMERAGWVNRVVLPNDRRAHLVSITEGGREIYAQARKRACTLQQEILGRLQEPDREEFLRLLEIVADACQGAQDDK